MNVLEGKLILHKYNKWCLFIFIYVANGKRKSLYVLGEEKVIFVS